MLKDLEKIEKLLPSLSLYELKLLIKITEENYNKKYKKELKEKNG